MPRGGQTDNDHPSARLVEQRMRNRLMEYLDLAASYEEQQAYEAAVPMVHVPYEVINKWEDSFPNGLERGLEQSSVYPAQEADALQRVRHAWEAAAQAIPDDYPPLRDAQALPQWEQLREAAASALAVFEQTGRLSEDREVP